MIKVISYSGGIDSTAVATSLIRANPSIDWRLCFIDMHQTSSEAQKVALAEMLRRFPTVKSHVIDFNWGFNPTTVENGIVLQNAGVLPLLFAAVARYAKQIGATDVYTGMDRFDEVWERAYELVVKGDFLVETVPITHFKKNGTGIQGTLDTCGVTWADVDFTVSCSGDPSDHLNPSKVPCGVCPKCRERNAFHA